MVPAARGCGAVLAACVLTFGVGATGAWAQGTGAPPASPSGISAQPLAPPPGAPGQPLAAPPATPMPSQPQSTAAQPTGPQSTGAQPAGPVPGQPVAPPTAGQPGAAPDGTPPPSSFTPAPAVPLTWQPQANAMLQVLDKVNAQSATLTIKVGQSAQYGALTIAVRACDVTPPTERQDATAFLDITDSHPDAPSFHGWMLKSDPSVSMLQHPLYDVRVLGCRP